MIVKHGWVLKNKRGKLYYDTFASDKASCWSEAFHNIEWERKSFRTRYWESWNHCVREAKKLGYELVKVKLVEIK